MRLAVDAAVNVMVEAFANPDWVRRPPRRLDMSYGFVEFG